MTDRLDRIEAILEQTARSQQQFADRINQFGASQQQLAESQQQLTDRINQIAVQQQESQQQISLLTGKINLLTERTDALTSAVTQISEIFAIDVAEFKANFMAVERRIEQIEERIEQIWQYLLDQLRSRGNGGS
jgi:peptidoglycan hydrolase CwlO-like protein